LSLGEQLCVGHPSDSSQVDAGNASRDSILLATGSSVVK
jgi:hypothetical protein